MNLTKHLAKYECHLMAEETSHIELEALAKDLPSDTHFVHYSIEGVEFMAGIRAFKMSDIFDALHDLGAVILEITQGYGKVKPRVWSAMNEAE